MPDYIPNIRLRNGTRRPGGLSGPSCPGINISTVFILLIILVSFPGCNRSISVPQHLIGEWRTSSPQYADRYLKISERSLVLGIGGGEKLSYDIHRVNTILDKGETVYTIHYKDMEGEKWSLTLVHSPDSGGTVKLKNSKAAWKRVKVENPA